MTGTSSPATTYALRRLEQREDRFGRVGIHGRHAMLALAVLADRDLNSPQGLDVVRADRVAAVVGLARSTVDRTLRSLAVADAGVVLVTEHACIREVLIGAAAAERLSRGTRVVGYRISEEAYR